MNNSISVYNEAAAFVLDRARRLVEQSGIDKPPFLSELLAPLADVKRIAHEDLGEISGLLLPVENGFIVKVNSRHSKERQNFSCAHEIVHTFFLDDAGNKLAKKVEVSAGRRRWRNILEKLCDLGASEILMPFWIFRSYASKYQFSIGAVRPLANVFQVSLPSAAIRIKEVNPDPCYMFFWKLNPMSEVANTKFELNWSSGPNTRLSTQDRPFLPIKGIRDKGSGIWAAYHSEDIIYSEECIKVPGFKQFCKVQSQGFGRPPYRYVISLAFPQ
ncbi:MAG: ImmA/IrrE family metallo-endopeptidase [Chloroflexota bacterium]